jgi:PPIC-type PPIASE domain
MTRYGFVCLLLGGLAMGQAANTKPATAPQAPATSTTAAPAAKAASEAPAVAPDAAVITIKGLCAQSTAQKSGAQCETVITRSEFEKVVDAVQPTMPARARRQFATRYANALVMATKAEQQGLDKGPDFDERMQLARIQVLSSELNRDMQEKAAEVSDKDIEDYYHANADKFEQAEVERIYIPKAQQPSEDEKKDDKAANAAAEEKRTQDSEQTMKNEADKLRARAAAGEDFAKLQAEAYQVAGIKSAPPNTNMGKVRRSMLPPSQASVMEMKVGEISAVIADQSGLFIYKVKSKEMMPLEQAKDEIKGTLRSEHLQEAMKNMQESTTSTLDEAYFGPEAPPRGGMMPGPGGMPAPPARPTTPPGPK